MMDVNRLTGEVTFDLAGKEYRLRATCANLAAFQAAAGVEGLVRLSRLVRDCDAAALYHGLRHLCTSNNAHILDDVLMPPIVGEISQAITAALVAGLPEVEERPGKPNAGRKTRPSRGNGIGNWPGQSAGAGTN